MYILSSIYWQWCCVDLSFSLCDILLQNWSPQFSHASLCQCLGCVLCHSVVSNSLRPHGLSPARLLYPWDFTGKNAEVGCHFLLQGIFRTQESNPGLLHCRQILYQLSYEGSQVDITKEFSKVAVPIYFQL